MPAYDFTSRLRLSIAALALALGITSTALQAGENGSGNQLGAVKNQVATSLVPGTRYDNIVNIGCGWASGVNFASGIDWAAAVPAILANPLEVYNILSDPLYQTKYGNRYAVLVKEALEARDGHTINLFDVAKTGHTSPYGSMEIDELDQIIEDEFGGQLTGNTLVLYEYGPPDFIRLIGMLFDRDPALNPIAASLGGDPFPPGASILGDSYWQARYVAELGGDPATVDAVLERYLGHFKPSTANGATPYVDETDILGPPNSNTLTVSDRFFDSYRRDYRRLLGNEDGKYGNKVDIIAIGNENVYEGGENFRQYPMSVTLDNNAVFPCGIFPTLLGCRPDETATASLGVDEDFVHPFAHKLEDLALDYSLKMAEQAKEEGVNLINVYDLFAGHHSRFDDPDSRYYVEDDPTYWAYMAEINALGQEVVADVMLHILNTGRKVYRRKHSDEFRTRALANEFPGVYGY